MGKGKLGYLLLRSYFMKFCVLLFVLVFVGLLLSGWVVDCLELL